MDQADSPRQRQDETDRLVELEEKLMFQQQLLEDMNGVLLEQQSELVQLRCELQNLRELVNRRLDSAEAGDLPDEKPPHY